MPEKQQPKTNKESKVKNILFLSLIIFLIAGLIFAVRYYNKPEPPKNYAKVTISTYKRALNQVEHFVFENQLIFNKPQENFYYSTNIKKEASLFNSAATKLSLNQRESNSATQTFLWYKNNDTSSNFLRYEKTLGTIDMSYFDGLSANNVADEETYKYLTEDLLSLPQLDSEVINIVKSDGENYVYTFSQKYNGKKIIFDSTSEIASTAFKLEGKFIQFYTFLTGPSESIQRKEEIKPLTQISNSNITGLYYYIDLLPNEVNSTGQGSEKYVNYPVSIFMEKAEETYLYMPQPDGSFVLYPAYRITGKYTDSKNQLGTSTVIVVNLDPS